MQDVADTDDKTEYSMKANPYKQGICIATAILLSACAQFGKQAPLEEPTNYGLSEGKSAAMVQDAWWMQLNDQKLNQLVALSIRNAPDLRIAKARFEQAQAQLGITEAANKMQIGLSSRGAGAYVVPKPSSGHIDTDHTLLLANTALQGTWSFDFWGKNRKQAASILGKRKAILYEAHQTRIDIANAVASQYFTWQMLLIQQNLLSERMETADKMQQLIRRRINARLASAESLYPVEMQQQSMQLEKLELERRIAKVRHALAILSGTTPDGLSLYMPEKMAAVPVVPVNKIHADLLGARPDIAAQKAMLESRFNTVKATEAEFYPNIELKVLAGLAHIDAFNVVRGRTSGMIGVLPALNLPIFTSGALQSKLAGRRAEYNEQVALYDRTVLNAMRAAADAVVDYQNMQKRQSVWEKMQETAEKTVRNANSRVNAGLDNGLSALQKQNELLQLKMQKAQYQAESLIAWSNLNTQLGGGFKLEPLGRNVSKKSTGKKVR